MPNERTSAIATHVLGILTLFIGPLVLYFALRKNASPWLRAHLDESVNYHILVLAAFIVLVGLAIGLTQFGLPSVALIAFLLAFLVFAASIVLGIVATIKAARGQAYHFPLDVRIVR